MALDDLVRGRGHWQTPEQVNEGASICKQAGKVLQARCVPTKWLCQRLLLSSAQPYACGSPWLLVFYFWLALRENVGRILDPPVGLSGGRADGEASLVYRSLGESSSIRGCRNKNRMGGMVLLQWLLWRFVQEYARLTEWRGEDSSRPAAIGHSVRSMWRSRFFRVSADICFKQMMRLLAKMHKAW